MIICKIFALLVSQITEDLQSAQVVWKFAGRNDWIENVDGSVHGKNCSHFGDDCINFALYLKIKLILEVIFLIFLGKFYFFPGFVAVNDLQKDQFKKICPTWPHRGTADDLRERL